MFSNSFFPSNTQSGLMITEAMPARPSWPATEHLFIHFFYSVRWTHGQYSLCQHYCCCKHWNIYILKRLTVFFFSINSFSSWTMQQQHHVSIICTLGVSRNVLTYIIDLPDFTILDIINIASICVDLALITIHVVYKIL